MSSEITKVTISIEVLDDVFSEILYKSLEPENNQIDDNSDIQMTLEKRRLFIKFTSFSSLNTVRNTLDDIFNTISTSENIYKTVKRKQNQI